MFNPLLPKIQYTEYTVFLGVLAEIPLLSPLCSVLPYIVTHRKHSRIRQLELQRHGALLLGSLGDKGTFFDEFDFLRSWNPVLLGRCVSLDL